MNEQPRPPFPAQQQPMPGATAAMHPRPDHGEKSYKGSGKLKGLAITQPVIPTKDDETGKAPSSAYLTDFLASPDGLQVFGRRQRRSNHMLRRVVSQFEFHGHEFWA